MKTVRIGCGAGFAGEIDAAVVLAARGNSTTFCVRVAPGPGGRLRWPTSAGFRDPRWNMTLCWQLGWRRFFRSVVIWDDYRHQHGRPPIPQRPQRSSMTSLERLGFKGSHIAAVTRRRREVRD